MYDWITVQHYIAGYLERYDRGYSNADIDPCLGYIQDRLGQRGPRGYFTFTIPYTTTLPFVCTFKLYNSTNHSSWKMLHSRPLYV
jgi:hypothetical protein